MVNEKTVPELDNQLKRTIKASLYILAGVSVALGLFPHDGVIWGVAIGIVTGIINSITLARRIKRLPDFDPISTKKFMKNGLFSRLGLIMAVLFFISRRLLFIDLFGVGAGLLVPYCISITLSVVDTLRMYRNSQANFKRLYEK